MSVTTLCIIAVQIFMLLVGIVICVKPLIRLNRYVEQLKKRVEGIDADNLPSLGIDNLSEGDDLFQGHEILWKCWQDYKLAVRSNTRHLPDPVPFFSYERIITGPAHRRFAEMLPGVFTGLGILGTFLGLVWGLEDMSVKDAAAIRQSIDLLISGMKTAFGTSIAGLILSLLWSLVDSFEDRSCLCVRCPWESLQGVY